MNSLYHALIMWGPLFKSGRSHHFSPAAYLCPYYSLMTDRLIQGNLFCSEQFILNCQSAERPCTAGTLINQSFLSYSLFINN